MSAEKLKLILLFNSRDESFTVVSHNLSEGDADGEIKRLRGEELPAYSLAQSGEHAAADAESCRACARDVRDVMSRRGKGAQAAAA
jgi:hypothetical protein